MALRPRTPGARALLPATRSRSSGPLGALLSSPALDVRLITALQVLQVSLLVRCLLAPSRGGVLLLGETWSAVLTLGELCVF